MCIPVLYVRANAGLIVSRERTGCLVSGFPPKTVRRIRSGPPGRSLPSIFQSSSRQDRSQTIMLTLRNLLVIATCLVTVVMPPALAKAVYDQRQTGDVNVQIDLKDLQVIALVNSELLEDYTDYDYMYDYADFTIKPGNKPTMSSVTGTTEKNDITQVSEPLPSQNSTISTSVNYTNPTTSDTTPFKGEGTPNATLSNTTESDKTLSKDEEIPNTDPLIDIASSNADNDNDKSQPGEEEEDGAGTTPSTTVKPAHAVRSQKRCKSGYVPNGDGRCRRAGRPWLSRLLP